MPAAVSDFSAAAAAVHVTDKQRKQQSQTWNFALTAIQVTQSQSSKSPLLCWSSSSSSFAQQQWVKPKLKACSKGQCHKSSSIGFSVPYCQLKQASYSLVLWVAMVSTMQQHYASITANA